MGETARHGNEDEYRIVWTGPDGSILQWEAENLVTVKQCEEYHEEQVINTKAKVNAWEADANRFMKHMRWMQILEGQGVYLDDEYAAPEVEEQ